MPHQAACTSGRSEPLFQHLLTWQHGQRTCRFNTSQTRRCVIRQVMAVCAQIALCRSNLEAKIISLTSQLASRLHTHSQASRTSETLSGRALNPLPPGPCADRRSVAGLFCVHPRTRPLQPCGVPVQALLGPQLGGTSRVCSNGEPGCVRENL